jgi:hypothetical protein
METVPVRESKCLDKERNCIAGLPAGCCVDLLVHVAHDTT